MADAQEVYAVLLALAGDTLLLPNIAVAEVLSHDRLQPAEGGPDWLAGHCEYNSRRLVVARFESLNGRGAREPGRRTRIAVVNCISGRLPTGQYGLICQGYPHLVTLNRTALQKELPEPNDRDDLILTRVKIANTAAAIPNLETLEAELAAL
ncbi:MAG TPA: chemotaxis protein CheW [Candidatus Binatia bacterium]|nr:chemotaxis protein CheW [Candidatus Binatia bacterium]